MNVRLPIKLTEIGNQLDRKEPGKKIPGMVPTTWNGNKKPLRKKAGGSLNMAAAPYEIIPKEAQLFCCRLS